MATETKRQWLPTTQFGMKGLVTQDDPQFIDEHALAGCMNTILDEAQMAPRKGTDLLYAAPAADVGHPEQMFKFNDNQGNEYLLTKFTNHWYVLDPRSNNWVMIGSQIPGDAIYTGVTWHDIYYSNDAYAHNQNIAFFAPSDYSTPDNDTDPVLFWDMGMTYLSQNANIGDISIVVEDTSELTLAPSGQSIFLNVGGEKVSAIAGTIYVDNGTLLTSGTAIVTSLTDTSQIEQGVSVTGAYIPSATIVQSIDSPTQITLSKNTTYFNAHIFNGTADTASTNTVTNLNISSSGTFTSGVYGGQYVAYGVQVFGGNVPLESGINYAITGTGIPSGTTATLSVVEANQWYIIVSLSPSNALTTTTGQTVTITNILTVGTVVTGSGIPTSTTISSLVGTIPLYTGFVMSHSATTSVTTNPITFSSSQPISLTFQDIKHLFLPTGVSLTANHVIGEPVTALIQSTKNLTGGTPFPQGNAVLMWLNSVVIAGATGAIMFSKPLDPFFYGGFYFTVATISGRINDMRAFGQFFIAGTENDLEIGQKIASADLTAVGAIFTPYLSGQGMGPISPQGTLLYNNTYYYPTSTNGIIALTPNFTGTSSAAGVEILTDSIHNFLRNATFLRAMAFNRKLYWLFSFPATPEFPSQTYFLVYDMIRKAFTLSDFQAVDVAYYDDNFCIMGPDGDVYAAEQDSYEDYSEGGSAGYLVEAYSKRYDMGEPSLPKDTQHVMVQGKILSGTNLFVDVLYNEGGALGKTTYQIIGDPASPYFTLPSLITNASTPFGVQTLGSGNLAVGNYRVYLELDKSYKWHNYQLRFYTEKAGSYWTVGIVSPNVELSTVPTELVISPQS